MPLAKLELRPVCHRAVRERQPQPPIQASQVCQWGLPPNRKDCPRAVFHAWFFFWKQEKVKSKIEALESFSYAKKWVSVEEPEIPGDFILTPILGHLNEFNLITSLAFSYSAVGSEDLLSSWIRMKSAYLSCCLSNKPQSPIELLIAQCLCECLLYSAKCSSRPHRQNRHPGFHKTAYCARFHDG